MVGGVWRDIVKAEEDLEGIGIGYTSSLKGVVGNGREIGFWVDKWLGYVRLCDRFSRLYHLDRRNKARVLDRGRWVNNEWCWEWEWVIELREDEVFTVKALTRMVKEKTLRIENGGQETLWNKCVPKKVNIFVWKALKGRLPVREELDKRGIDLDSTSCSCCDSVAESCVHSLVLCNFSMSVWEKVFSWWKLRSVNAFSIGELFYSNGNVDIPNCSILLWQAVIWTSGYYIWKVRNARVFKGKVVMGSGSGIWCPQVLFSVGFGGVSGPGLEVVVYGVQVLLLASFIGLHLSMVVRQIMPFAASGFFHFKWFICWDA
ncbi:reverse transcriptase domain, reverse transcriptase zinc-binding domain protein [Tanacetum coccineum]